MEAERADEDEGSSQDTVLYEDTQKEEREELIAKLQTPRDEPDTDTPTYTHTDSQGREVQDYWLLAKDADGRTYWWVYSSKSLQWLLFAEMC